MANYDLQDPDLDFAGKAEIISRALKQSQVDKVAQADDPKMMGGWVMNTGPMGGVAAAMQRGLGTYNEAEANTEKEQLDKEQLRRYDELTRRMSQPGTKKVKVFEKALNPEGAPLGLVNVGEGRDEEVPLDLSDPNDLAADNARRMGVAGEMYKLPMAQKVAQDYLSKGANFPEALALLKTKQIEQAQQAAAQRATQMQLNADRIASREQMAQLGRENTAAIAGANTAIAQGRLDDQRRAAQEKADKEFETKQRAYQSSIAALAPIETSLAGLLTKPDKEGKRGITPELEAYTGNLDQYMPDYLLKQGTVDAGAKLNALKDQITMINLAQAKQAVGQSFGSMQVKEWDKFVNTLSSLDRKQGKAQLAESLSYVDNYIKNHKAELETALASARPGGPNPRPVSPGLGGGESKVIGGKTYVKVNGQWEEQ